MKIALVHDHLISDGGGERVLKAFCDIWPEAPIFTLIHDPKKTNPEFAGKDIRASYLQRLPLATYKYHWYLPLRPRAVKSFDLDDFDVVLSNSSSLVKGVVTSPWTLHINYCHTPTRFLWVDETERVDPLERVWPISKVSDWYKETYLREWDVRASRAVDVFISNSRNVQQRICDFYHRNSELLYPPVDVDMFEVATTPGNYFLTGGRLVSYKKFDITIKAFNRLNIPLKVFGTGPDLARLKRIAGRKIEFLGVVPDETKKVLYKNAKAFINPQIEDFGITPVESMASGRPVIAYRSGGALETIVAGKTGLFFADHDWESLADAVIRFNQHKFDPSEIRLHAGQFSEDLFKAGIKNVVDREWGSFRSR